MTPEEVAQSKEVEFYTQGVNAWYNSALEHDKSLLTLSVAGLGVLVSLMSTGVTSIEAFLLYAAAIFSFLVCLLSVLMIFKQNRKHIENVFNGKVEPDSFLKILDTMANTSFFIAILFSSIIGISTAFHSYTEKGKKMATENSKTSTPVAAYDSVNGLAKLNPSFESYNGIASLQNRSSQGVANLQLAQAAQAQTTQSSVPQQQAETSTQTASKD